jgi:hypothetical protein
MADVWADPVNCGSCGHDCLGGACNAGECAPFVLAVTHGSIGIAIDSTFVYWADNEAGVIDKLSKDLTHAGTPSVVASGDAAASVQGIASDGTYVYWTNKMSGGQVRRALPTGANMTTIATGQSQPDWVVSNGSLVVWTNQGSNTVMAAPAWSDGGIAPTQLNLSGEFGTAPAGLAIDGSRVYYATKTNGGGLAESAPLDGGAVAVLGAATYVSISVDDVHAFWTGGAISPSVYVNAKGGTPGTQRTLVTNSALNCPLALLSDGTDVYFLDQGSPTCAQATSDAGALYRVSIADAGGLPPPLVSGLADPQAMAVDSRAIYWVTGGPDGAVMRLAK